MSVCRLGARDAAPTRQRTGLTGHRVALATLVWTDPTGIAVEPDQAFRW